MVGEHRDIFRAAQQFEDKLRKAKSIHLRFIFRVSPFLSCAFIFAGKRRKSVLVTGAHGDRID